MSAATASPPSSRPTSTPISSPAALELAARTGAPVYASWESGRPPRTRRSPTGRVGRGRLPLAHGRFWTPGHTPEHLAFLLIEPGSRQGSPVALFSGESFFVGEVGRPDLLGRGANPGTRHQVLPHRHGPTLRGLPDDLIVYPGHTAGSACGKKIGEAPYTTIRGERIGNYAFQARSRDTFVQMVLNGMPLAPTYYPVMKQVNKVGATPLADLPHPARSTRHILPRRLRSGAVIIDARPFERFGEGHIPGAIAAGLGENFLAWMGWLAPYDRDIVLVLPSDEDLDEAVTELRRIGLDRISGYLAGGMGSWTGDGRDIRIAFADHRAGARASPRGAAEHDRARCAQRRGMAGRAYPQGGPPLRRQDRPGRGPQSAEGRRYRHHLRQWVPLQLRREPASWNADTGI